jgi:membrane protein DedA with SNARE-associated domain
VRIYLAVSAGVLSTTVLPVPEEAALLGAGFAAHPYLFWLLGCFLASWLAILIGDIGTFLVGRFLLGTLSRSRWIGHTLTPACPTSRSSGQRSKARSM